MPQFQALRTLMATLTCGDPNVYEIQNAWLDAVLEAVGTRYERRLLAAEIAPDLENRVRVLETVQGIVEGFENA